jgi:gas vesicle protein GvpN
MAMDQIEKNTITTPAIQDILERCKAYLKVGFPVHLTGPAGTGKTTLAIKLAKIWGQPYYLIQGDDSFNRQDLIGGLFGYSQKVIEDNFIASVSKFERRLTPIWVDNPVAIACREGGTLIYDEFTRARPETNNLLLGILSEHLFLTSDRSGRMTLESVHPNFSLILTSNPQEYVGVNKTQDALSDRIITIQLSQFDEETEAAIAAKQAGIHADQALKIVRFVRRIKQQIQLKHSSVRSSIMIGKIYANVSLHENNPLFFYKCCHDIFGEDLVTLEQIRESWLQA